jgi:hypothetical protein
MPWRFPWLRSSFSDARVVLHRGDGLQQQDECQIASTTPRVAPQHSRRSRMPLTNIDNLEIFEYRIDDRAPGLATHSPIAEGSGSLQYIA